MHSAVHEALAAIWRIESARIVAVVARRVQDLGVAEELAHDALVAALERWPVDGVPRNPGAWLMTTALRRALDHLRHRAMAGERHALLADEAQVLGPGGVDDPAEALAGPAAAAIGDDLLRLVFVACHPVLAPDARVALTLRLLCGLTTTEIARAFLVPEPTIAQRLVRAKRRLAEARVPFEVPQGPELAARLGSVLEVVYLVFNEGYTATRGEDWMRPQLCDEALRLARSLARLAPREPEVHGLLALLELQASRLPARTSANGDPVLLAEQDRSRWDRLLIRLGLAALARAAALGPEPGPYRLQAEIAACHARAHRAASTDWARIAALYDALLRVMPSPVVALNRAVAVSMADGAAAALPLVEALLGEPALARYPWLPAVHGDLLLRCGRADAAAAAFERAAALSANARERDLLARRAAQARGDAAGLAPRT